MKLLITLFAVLVASLNWAQDPKLYKIREAQLNAVVYSDSGSVHFGSKLVRIVIDNESLKIVVRVEPDELTSDVDSMSRKLKASSLGDVIFEGMLNVPIANTKGHADQDLEIEGYLKIGEITTQVAMMGVLKNYSTGPDISSMLYIHFDLDLVKYRLTSWLPAGATVGCIEILLPILEPGYMNK